MVGIARPRAGSETLEKALHEIGDPTSPGKKKRRRKRRKASRDESGAEGMVDSIAVTTAPQSAPAKLDKALPPPPPSAAAVTPPQSRQPPPSTSPSSSRAGPPDYTLVACYALLYLEVGWLIMMLLRTQ